VFPHRRSRWPELWRLPLLRRPLTPQWRSATEATHATVEVDVETSTQEAAATQESVATIVRDMKDRATLAKRGAWERVSKMVVESVVVLAFAREDVASLVQRITLLRGELTGHVQEMAEENSWGLFDAATDAERWSEESEMESQEQFEELIFCRPRALSCALT
jgi:hypothetical protein